MSDRVILDQAALERLRETLGVEETEVYTMVLRLFLSDAPQLLTDLRQGVQQNDLRVVQRAAHTLRSNCDTFGAQDLAQLCRELEVSCREGDCSRWTEQVSAIEEMFPPVSGAIQEELVRVDPKG